MKRLSAEEKRKLQAKIAEHQKMMVQQAKAQGQPRLSAWLQAEKEHSAKTRKRAHKLTDEEKRILQAKIIEQERLHAKSRTASGRGSLSKRLKPYRAPRIRREFH